MEDIVENVYLKNWFEKSSLVDLYDLFPYQLTSEIIMCQWKVLLKKADVIKIQ